MQDGPSEGCERPNLQDHNDDDDNDDDDVNGVDGDQSLMINDDDYNYCEDPPIEASFHLCGFLFPRFDYAPVNQ